MIIYLLMVFVIGLPIFFSELFVGQFSGLGPTKAYTYMAPFFQGKWLHRIIMITVFYENVSLIYAGLGYCTIVVITFVTIYYMVIMAWCIFYLYESFWPVLGNNMLITNKTYMQMNN
jgi:SNF family Na+-dependent transporter